jgi:hypothetical protein
LQKKNAFVGGSPALMRQHVEMGLVVVGGCFASFAHILHMFLGDLLPHHFRIGVFMGVNRVGLGCMDMGGWWWESGREWDGGKDWEKGMGTKEWRSAI